MELIVTGDFMLDHEFAPNKPPQRETFQKLHKADLVFANLETPIAAVGHPREKMYTYRAPPPVVKVLRSAGVDVISLANNHMLDYGEEALLHTLNTLSKEKIPYVGAGRNIDEASEPVILERDGIRIGFLGLAATLPLGAAASASRPGIAPVHVSTSYEVDPTLLQEQPGEPPKIRTQVTAEDENRVCQNIRRTRAKVHHVVVGIHWGVAFTNKLAEYVQPFGRKMIEAGASLIVGHHPHVVQGVERHGGGVVLYSLGDFVFHDRVDMTGESGMIASAQFDKRKIRSLRLYPITVDLKTGHPILGKVAQAKQLLKTLKALSAKERFSLEGQTVRLTL